MGVEKVNQSCFHGPVKISIYHISHINSVVYMKRFVIDKSLHCPGDTMTVCVKHFNLYLPLVTEAVILAGLSPPPSTNLIFSFTNCPYGMMLFTVEHKKLRIRQYLWYVEMYSSQL